MYVTAEKSCKTAERDNTPKVPYSKELESFMTESRKAQTFYSNYEDNICRGIFKFNERHLIEKYIASTIFFKENDDRATLLYKEDKLVKNLTDKIIEESRKYNCEIQFGVIWVNCFIYDNAETKLHAVFKIYKDKTHDQAIYLDVFSTVYQTWESFLDNPELGGSLLCVPRNGKYSFDNGVLNLEYVLAKSFSQKFIFKFAFFNNLEINVRSFYHAFVMPWLERVQSWLLGHPKILELVNKFKDFCAEHNILGLAVGVLVAFFLPEFSIIMLDKKIFPYVLNSVKILSILLKSGGLKEKKESKLLNAFESAIDEAVNGFWKIFQEAVKLAQLLRKSSKNWNEILTSLSCLIESSRTLNETTCSDFTTSKSEHYLKKTGSLMISKKD